MRAIPCNRSYIVVELEGVQLPLELPRTALERFSSPDVIKARRGNSTLDFESMKILAPILVGAYIEYSKLVTRCHRDVNFMSARDLNIIKGEYRTLKIINK